MLTNILVQTLRSWLDGQPMDGPLPEGISAPAEAHRLAGTLYHIGAKLGDRDAQICSKVWSTQAGAHLRRIERLTQLWPREAPPPLVIKGADLAENVFQDPGARRAIDLDLLIPEPEFKRIARQLALQSVEVRVPRHERFSNEPPHSLGFIVDGLLFELHSSPQPAHRAHLTGKTLYEHSIPGHLGELAVRYPAQSDRLLLWLTNLAKGAFFTDLSDLLDGALLLRGMPIPHDAIAKARLTRALSLAVCRLGQSGLRTAAPLPLWTKVLSCWLPNPLVPRQQPHPLIFQVVKLGVMSPSARLGSLTRAVFGSRASSRAQR